MDMRKFSITDKLIIASFIISIAIILIVASYSFYNAKEAILDRSFNQLNSVRVIKTNLIEKFFSNCTNEVQLAATSTNVHEIVIHINDFDKSTDYQFVQENILDFDNAFVNEIKKEYYSSIFIIGTNKLIYSIKKNNAERNNMDYDFLWKSTLAKESIYINDYTKLADQDPVYITISSKIIDSKRKTCGIIVFEIMPEAIDSNMLNNDPSNGLGTSGESYLVGQDYLLRSSSRFQKESVLNTSVHTESVDLAFANLSGAKVVEDYRGIEVLSSFSKINIPNLNWVILAEIDYKEVTVPIYKIRNEIVFISIFIFLIVLIVIIVLSRKITFPIQKLNQAAQAVGAGDLDVKLLHHSNDEIGELSDSFNQMVEKLKKQTRELEVEKSKSLRSLIDGQELERQRLSRELHDSLGQQLIGLKFKYENCLNEQNLESKRFNDLSVLFDQVIEETRRISNNLIPAALSEFGLTTAIRNICNEISETNTIHIQYNLKGSGKELSIELKTYLFRIVQEALTNIIKHSEAKNAVISLTFKKKSVYIHIEDDGKGFDLSKTRAYNSNGLNNINDRVSLLSGKLLIESAKSKGTKITIEIPINTVSDE
jgi:signal transduction histidine kinase